MRVCDIYRHLKRLDRSVRLVSVFFLVLVMNFLFQKRSSVGKLRMSSCHRLTDNFDLIFMFICTSEMGRG